MPDFPLYLVRLSPEVTTKARRTRRRFQERLVQNLRDALSGLGGHQDIRNKWDRLLIEADQPGAAERIAGVFGVSSVSRVDARVPPDLDRIVAVGHELYRERVGHHRTFAVKARRSGRHAFGSRDVCVRLGAALNPYGEVNLSAPDITVAVEVREEEAFLFCGREEGAGGLPLGVEGKAVCLISGGFDSPVAAWLVLRRGVSLDYVFCNLAGGAYERMVASITKVVADEWSFGDHPRLHVVDFTAVVDDLRAKAEPRYWQVVLKRLMYRAAEAVALELKAEAIVTGEAIGQVSSQTLGNLRAIDAVATLPVFRPLLGFDKSWIIKRAEEIGTAALSARVHEHCAIVPDKPVTHASPERVAAQESDLDLALLRQAVGERRVLDLRRLSPADLVEPYLFIDEVPEGAVVLDCRPSHQHRAWHYPGAELQAPHEVVARMKELSKEPTYVLYCDAGVQTAHLAEVMQRLGYEAYSFRGGAVRLREWAGRQRAERRELMAIHIGTSGWSYQEWKGSFYPPDLASDAMLSYYADRFNSVEVNNTFYRLPKREVLAGWAGKVPLGFSLVIKASQRITHKARVGADAADPLAYLLDACGELGDRLGPVLFQTPPWLKRDVPLLKNFLALLPPEMRGAFEFRSTSWFDEEIYEALRERNAALVLADTGEEEKDPPLVRTADWGYARLRRVEYPGKLLETWAQRLGDIGWDHLWAFFKHEDEGTGPRLAARFRELIGS